MKAITVRLGLFLALIASIALMAPMAATVEANVGLNMDQCANGTLANLAEVCGSASPPPEWQNGNINQNNAQYREGDGLPYRNAITGLTNGTWSVSVDYDFTKGGKFALDRLTRFNLTQASNPCFDTTDVTCTVGSPAFTFPMPGEVASPNVNQPALPNSGALDIAGTASTVDVADRLMTVWVNGGGSGSFVAAGSNCTGTQATSLNDSVVAQSGLVSGNSNRQFGFKLTLSGCPAGGCNVMLGWTGHISSAVDWGADMGAASITGAPFHMRIVGVDNACGTSGGNQDRSVQLSALAAPTQGTLTVIKHVVGGSNVASNFTITVKDSLSTTVATFPGAESPGSSANLAAGTYTVSESAIAGYTAVFSGDCNGSGVVSVTSGQTSTCTITNTFPESTTLTVIKHVVGGTASANNFTMTITGPTSTSFPGAESPGITTTVEPGSYTVSESSVTDYTATFSGDCNSSGVVTLSTGQTKTCTVTNTLQGPPPAGIPTLSEWGMIGMAFVLAGAAVWYLRSRPMRLT